MPFERKSGRKNPVTFTDDLPDKVMAPLPEAVIKRFPELKDWEQRNQEHWDTLKEVHQRHLDELTNAVNDALEATKPKR